MLTVTLSEEQPRSGKKKDKSTLVACIVNQPMHNELVDFCKASYCALLGINSHNYLVVTYS